MKQFSLLCDICV